MALSCPLHVRTSFALLDIEIILCSCWSPLIQTLQSPFGVSDRSPRASLRTFSTACPVSARPSPASLTPPPSPLLACFVWEKDKMKERQLRQEEACVKGCVLVIGLFQQSSPKSFESRL
ncbi:hypothetical protein NL108_017368 [Boleophthalmus pectinirostris]|nr:hypothetical protein NL108_017368 [Boleophthalmus pectinirostris]